MTSSPMTNGTRASFAAAAIETFNAVCANDPDQIVQAKDLITNLVHFLRIECGLSIDDALATAHNAISMAETETAEDED